MTILKKTIKGYQNIINNIVYSTDAIRMGKVDEEKKLQWISLVNDSSKNNRFRCNVKIKNYLNSQFRSRTDNLNKKRNTYAKDLLLVSPTKLKPAAFGRVIRRIATQ